MTFTCVEELRDWFNLLVFFSLGALIPSSLRSCFTSVLKLLGLSTEWINLTFSMLLCKTRKMRRNKFETKSLEYQSAIFCFENSHNEIWLAVHAWESEVREVNRSRRFRGKKYRLQIDELVSCYVTAAGALRRNGEVTKARITPEFCAMEDCKPNYLDNWSSEQPLFWRWEYLVVLVLMNFNTSFVCSR